MVKDSASKFENGAYKEFTVQNRTAAGNAEQFSGKVDYVNKMLTAYADDLSVVLDKPYLMSDAELETAIEGYGQPGWSPPPIAEYVSQRIKWSCITI